MVGFDPKVNEVFSKYEQALAGAVSGVLTRAWLQPLDVIKIRFQLQVEPLSQNAGKYSSMFQALRTIIREEKTSALWKGHVPAQFLSIAFGISQGLTISAWHYLPKELTHDHRPSLHFVCGGMAGCIATITSFPFDVIRTRLVAQGEPKMYSGMFDAASKMYKTHGTLIFFRGLWPTMIQVAPYTGFQFGFYTGLTQMWKTFFASSEVDTGWLESFVCGSIAGMSAKSIVYPFDLSKKRMQVQGFHEARKSFGHVFKCSGMTDCLIQTVKKEGWLGLYKGYLPSLVKAALATGLTFGFYEQLLRIFKRLHLQLDKKTS